jgi:hypothetical protein
MGPTLSFDFRSRKSLPPGLYLLSKTGDTRVVVSERLSWLTALCDVQREALAEAGGKYVDGIWTPY